MIVRMVNEAGTKCIYLDRRTGQLGLGAALVGLFYYDTGFVVFRLAFL